MAAAAAIAAAPSAPAAPRAAPAVGPAAAAIAAAEAAAAVAAAAAAAKAAKAEKSDSDSDETSMSDAEVLPEVELATLGEAGAATAGQAGLPCGVLPVVDAPVAVAPPPVEVPVGDAGFALSPVLLGLLGLGALGLGYLLLKGDDDDNNKVPIDNNEPPVITSGATASVDENVPAGTEVYDANATDADGDTITYSLSGADAASFTINATTGEVTINASPDFEADGTYNFTVTANDGNGGTDTQDVVLTVNDLNEAPVITSGATATVPENAPTTTVVYDAEATDPDGDTLTYSLTGPDAALFTIDPVTGEVRLVNSADFETRSTYNITVVATDPDGASDSQDVVVTVSDVAEGPTLVVRSLDVDNDANTLTPFQIDAGDEWYQFVDDDDISNNVSLINFGPEDYIVFDAPFSGPGAVAFANLGDTDVVADGLGDLLITINKDGTLTQIVLEDAVAADAFIFDEATADAAVAGVDNFRTTAGPAGTTSLDTDSDNDLTTPQMFDASTGNVAFTDNVGVANNAIVTGIGTGDTLTLAPGANTVSFANNGGDLIVTTNDGGVVSQITFADAVAVDAVVTDAPTAETALGFDFFQFA